MNTKSEQGYCRTALPNWVPQGAARYLAHTEAGQSIRELARQSGCHASTVLRQIRRFETRRDDPLIDAALRTLGVSHFREVKGTASRPQKQKDHGKMTAQISPKDMAPDEQTLAREATRILRRLCETGAVLAVAQDMEKAVVVRDTAAGISTRTAVVDRAIAQAMALKDWIVCKQSGRITRYQITAAGRSALTRFLAEHESRTGVAGFAEAPATFADQQQSWGEKDMPEEAERPRRMRYNLAESPLTALARRRDKNGEPFLADDLVTAGERLREDFELAQMGQRVTQNWDNFLTGSDNGGFVPGNAGGGGASAARDRVSSALADLGPGLGDVVLRCCCYLEGLETAEKRMGWSARSGKIVLRIALQRLKRHYDETIGPGGPLIG